MKLGAVVALILVAVLVPTACILYFMNEAINNQRDVAHQKLAEAYRGGLRAMMDRLESFWSKREAELDGLQGSPAVRFRKATADQHLADAIILLGDSGNPAYPTPPAEPAADPAAALPAWQAARALEKDGRFQAAASAWLRLAETQRDTNLAGRALQAQIRCLVRAGERGVLPLIDRFQTEPFVHARDLQWRSIAADELLLGIHLLPKGDARRAALAGRLHAVVADYSNDALPSSQRLFLMEELRGLQLGEGIGEFPTYDAERLAAQYIEAGRVRATDAALRLSDLPGVWKLGTPRRRAIALYREKTVISDMPLFEVMSSVDPATVGANVTFGISPPGQGGFHDTVLVGGGRLPGWQLSLDLTKTKESAEVANRQRISYLWVGLLVIATLAVTGLIAARMFLRQVRLTRLKTDLVATVSHELKTPLAGMRLLVDTLLDDPVSDPVRTREYLQLIARENARLSRLIDNFLTFSRMERNRAQFDFARTRAEDLVRAAVDSVGDRFHVETSIGPDLPALHADEDAIVTVLLNLLDNAYKYSAEPRRIELSVYREQGRCCFAVADNGIGIPARQQKRIFRRFYQVERHLTRRPGGVGLGLSIVEFIVKAHGGTVRVESRPGAGSRFMVCLPATDSVREAAA